MLRIAILLTTILIIGCTEKAPVYSDQSSQPERLAAPVERGRGKTIVKLTPGAIERVREFQKKVDLPYLRVGVAETGDGEFMYLLNLDGEYNEGEDYLDKSSGFQIVVDRTSAPYLQGTSIDWVVKEDGRGGFSFDNPNAR